MGSVAYQASKTLLGDEAPIVLNPGRTPLLFPYEGKSRAAFEESDALRFEEPLDLLIMRIGPLSHVYSAAYIAGL